MGKEEMLPLVFRTRFSVRSVACLRVLCGRAVNWADGMHGREVGKRLVVVESGDGSLYPASLHFHSSYWQGERCETAVTRRLV